MICSPIALFVYNRPEHTRKTVDALVANDLSEESDLTIFSDGPQSINDITSVRKVRDYIHNIRGFKSVTIIERSENFGLAKSIVTGVTELVNRYDRIIVLEDDIVTSPSFLKFMNEALEVYKSEKRVMQVSGHMFDVVLTSENDAILLPFISTWGWGTWGRAWSYFDQSLDGYTVLKQSVELRHKFDLEGNYNYFDLLERQVSRKVDSWGIFWNLSVFMNNGLVLYPVNSLVLNCGFDGSGIHCRNVLQPTNKHRRLHGNNFRFPNAVVEDVDKDRVYKAIYSINHPGLLTIIRLLLLKIVDFIKKVLG